MKVYLVRRMESGSQQARFRQFDPQVFSNGSVVNFAHVISNYEYSTSIGMFTCTTLGLHMFLLTVTTVSKTKNSYAVITKNTTEINLALATLDEQKTANTSLTTTTAHRRKDSKVELQVQF